MTAPIGEAFAGRPVFITGHTGFKGSWLTIWLHHLRAKITGYSLAPPTEPSNYALSGVRDLLVAHHEADIRDAGRLAAAVREARPEVVFHLAAQPLVREGYAAPRQTFDVNVTGTACVLDAVRSLGKPCVIVVITSDKCYENRGLVWGHRECDPLGGSDPYSASKAAAELLISAYRHSFFNLSRLEEHGVKLASARAGNVIGGGDWARHRIVTDIVTALGAGHPVRLRSPRAVRPWQHVLEPLHGYLLLAAKMLGSDPARYCDAWNFGPMPGHEVPVARLAERFLEEWGAGSSQEVGGADHRHEEEALRLSIDRALRVLGWRPRWGLDEAVRRTVRWYRRHYDEAKSPMRDECLADIAAYESAPESRDVS